MIPAILIAKKRDKHPLDAAEIEAFVRGYLDGQVEEAQMAAMAMAICLNGMEPKEISALTQVMLESGDRLPRKSSELPRVDKHSTGGLGDKVSIILAPLLASCDVAVPMISGRGLGLSGGTLDKLEAIPGFRCDLPVAESRRTLDDVGCHIISASAQIAPADRKLYALRDVTGTVESVALITASILSKKLAASLDALVMDVKVGSGAFMKSRQDAQDLAGSLVSTGSNMGLPVTALLTDMDQPLGVTIGNSLEINESVEVLQGGGPNEVRELTVELCAELLVAVKTQASRRDARTLLNRKLDEGVAWEKFQEMIRLQGGRWDAPLPVAPKHAILAPRSGYLAQVDCQALGACIVSLGGGRRQKSDRIQFDVGLGVHRRIGQYIEQGDEIVSLHGSKDQYLGWQDRICNAFRLSDQAVASRELILERTQDGQ